MPKGWKNAVDFGHSVQRQQHWNLPTLKFFGLSAPTRPQHVLQSLRCKRSCIPAEKSSCWKDLWVLKLGRMCSKKARVKQLLDVE